MDHRSHTSRTTRLVHFASCHPHTIFPSTRGSRDTMNPTKPRGVQYSRSTPTTDLILCAPIYSTHVLRYTAARLDINPLQHITRNPTTPHESAKTTALGHTLLHIAAFPSTEFPQSHNIPQRSRFAHPRHERLVPRSPRNRLHIWTLPRPLTPEDETGAHLQADIVLWLFGKRNAGFCCTRYAQEHSVSLPCLRNASGLCASKQSKNTARRRKESKNELGISSEDLWEDAKAAEIE